MGDEDLEHEQIIDPPPSWVSKLSIGQEISTALWHYGSRINLYIRSKVELFAENVHEMGPIQRTTMQRPWAHYAVGIVETFVNRRDKLYKRVHSIKVFMPRVLPSGTPVRTKRVC